MLKTKMPKLASYEVILKLANLGEALNRHVALGSMSMATSLFDLVQQLLRQLSLHL